MASQTRPFLKTGAALASAAVVVAATPAIAPSLTAASVSVSTSGVNLATFADIFTIPSEEWVASYFQGFGGIVGPNNPMPLEPWASTCDTSTGPGCYVAGVSGVAYLALDALINGNGEGWADNGNWTVGAVNYFFEGGTPSAGVEYLLQESLGQSNELVSVLITLFFTGPQLVTVIYDNALQLISEQLLAVPVVGEYLYGAINAYLGPASLDANFQGYTQGLSGILNYTIDALTGNAPSPSAALAAPAAVLAAAPAAAATALVSAASADAVESVSAAEPAAESEPAATVEVSAPSATETAATGESEAPESPAAEPTVAETTTETTTEATPAVDSAADAVAETAAEPADVDADKTESEAAADSKPSESAAPARKRPLRDALDRATKSIGSALKGQKADAATSAADSAS